LTEHSSLQSALLSLPFELYLDIFLLLRPRDLISIKHSCRRLGYVVSSEEETLFFFFLKRTDRLPGAFDVYRSTILPGILPTLDGLVNLQSRVDVVDRLLRFLITEILNESFRADASEWYKDPTKRACFHDIINDIRPFLLLLGHFFEAFKAYFACLLREKGDVRSYDDIRFLQSWILRHYSPHAAQRLTLIYRDLMRSLGRKLRPPSYANRAERTLRGWTHDPAKPEDCRDIAIFGGLQVRTRYICCTVTQHSMSRSQILTPPPNVGQVDIIGKQTILRIISMTGFNSRMRATDRFLARYLGRSRSVKPDEFSSGITQPLDRDIAELIRPCLTEFRYFLPQDARELAGVMRLDVDESIHYQAGFGCKVFVADYEPEDDPRGRKDKSTGLSLVAHPPRHACDCQDTICECENIDYVVYLRSMTVLHEHSQARS